MFADRVIDKFIRKNPATGSYEPAEYRRYILPYWRYFEQSDITGAYTVAAAAASSQLVTYKQEYSSANGADAYFGTPFEVKNLVVSSETTGTSYNSINCTVMLSEVGATRQFMNYPVHIRTIFGDAAYPGRLREPFMFFSQEQIHAKFATLNTGASAESIRPYLTGAAYYPWACQSDTAREKMLVVLRKMKNRKPFVWPFWLTTDTPITPTAAEQSFQLVVGQDAHFVARSIAAISLNSLDFEWVLLEPRSGTRLANGKATATNSLGDARLPTVLPVPYVVPAGYKLQLIINNSGAADTIYFTINGSRVYADLKDVPAIACN